MAKLATKLTKYPSNSLKTYYFHCTDKLISSRFPGFWVKAYFFQPPGGSNPARIFTVAHEPAIEENADLDSDGLRENDVESSLEVDEADRVSDASTTPPPRKSARGRVPKMIFTFDEKGGSPVMKRVTLASR